MNLSQDITKFLSLSAIQLLLPIWKFYSIISPLSKTKQSQKQTF